MNLSPSQGTVVESASRALSSAKQNYTTVEKECLAIIWASCRFRCYLLIGGSICSLTDHTPLLCLESAKKVALGHRGYIRTACLEFTYIVLE